MAFDVEGYRKAAKEAGFSDEEIQKDIDEETQNLAAKGADANMANVKVGTDFMGIPEWLQPAAAMTAAGLAGAGAVGVGLKLKDRKATPEQPTARVEPTFGIPDVEANQPQPETQPQQKGKFTPPQGDVTDVASRPVGEPRLQIGGPRALPASEAAIPAAVTPSPTTPTGPAPETPVAPPAEVAPAPVQPKPIDAFTQAKIDALAADQRRKDEAHAAEQRRRDEAHANRMAQNAQKAETVVQKKTSGGLNEQDRQMLASSEKAKIEKAIAADQKAGAKTKPVASVEPITTTTPTSTAAETQVVPVEKAAPTEVKGAKAPKWPGGAEGSALQQFFGATKKTLSPEHMAGLELFKEHVGGPLTMPASGGSIHQVEQANSFVQKYSGSPLPRGEDGKLLRLPEEQIQKIHTGIRTELEDAVKGNKLGTLGKGAMAAAALLGLTGAVQAAQKGDFGPLRQAGFDIGGPIALGKLGLTALSRAGGAGFSAATYSGNLNEGEQEELARRRHDYMMKESQKLGSPLRSVPPPK
jgi:hypothetical protein